jgi:3-methyladenine DNA glycosylase AlkD
MTANEILNELGSLGTEQTRKTFLRHGAREPFFGVKIGDLKKIQKRIKMDHPLALELYDTGVSDAMYLAGLIADDAKMTKQDLQRWVNGAYWHMMAFYTVPWVAAGSKHGREMALKWIDSKKELVASAGWMTLGSIVAVKDDEELDVNELKQLLGRVEKTIHKAPNLVRYAMNQFVIYTGGYVKALTSLAIKTAERIGDVNVEMGDTACQVPDAKKYIEKVKANGKLGKKRKSAKC